MRPVTRVDGPRVEPPNAFETYATAIVADLHRRYPSLSPALLVAEITGNDRLWNVTFRAAQGPLFFSATIRDRVAQQLAAELGD